jgi:class 3 adenylate cyclase
MAKDRLSGKLAVILHADIVGSTALVHQDEQLAHQRIQDTFRRFGDTVSKYYGQVRELKPQGTSHTFVSAPHGKQSDNVIWY